MHVELPVISLSYIPQTCVLYPCKERDLAMCFS